MDMISSTHHATGKIHPIKLRKAPLKIQEEVMKTLEKDLVAKYEEVSKEGIYGLGDLVNFK